MRISSKSRISVVLFLALMLLPMSTSAQNSMVELVIPYSNSSTAYAINELDQAPRVLESRVSTLAFCGTRAT